MSTGDTRDTGLSRHIRVLHLAVYEANASIFPRAEGRILPNIHCDTSSRTDEVVRDIHRCLHSDGARRRAGVSLPFLGCFKEMVSIGVFFLFSFAR